MTTRLLRLAGISLLAAAALAPLLLACNCSDPTPSTRTCPVSAVAPTVTALELYSGSGRLLEDRSALPVARGAQGGSHWSFALELTGSNLSGCVEVSVTTRSMGSDGALYSGTVVAMGDDARVRTTEIVVFGRSSWGASQCVEVTAQAYGQRIARRLYEGDPSACDLPPDAGPPDARPAMVCGNGSVEGSEQCDEVDPALCTDRCRRPACADGVASPGEACFQTAATTDLGAPVIALGALGDSSDPGVVAATVTQLYRLALPALSQVGAPLTLPFSLTAPPAALAAGDLDGDGARDDAAVVSSLSLAVTFGGTDGSLGAPVVTALPSSAVALVAAQLDADDADELVLALADGTVFVLDAAAPDLVGPPALSGLTGVTSVAAFRTTSGLDGIALARPDLGALELYSRSGADPFSPAGVAAGPSQTTSLLAVPSGAELPLILEGGDFGLVELLFDLFDGGSWRGRAVDAFGPVNGLSITTRDGLPIVLASSDYVARAFGVATSAPALRYWLPLGDLHTRAVVGLPDGSVLAAEAGTGRVHLLSPAD